MTITAHDVRRIKICSSCGEIGIYQPPRAGVGVPIVICTNSLRAPGAAADYKHPVCYAGASVTKLMILPKDELDCIRICDVSEEQMKGILVAAGAGQPEPIQKRLRRRAGWGK